MAEILAKLDEIHANPSHDLLEAQRERRSMGAELGEARDEITRLTVEHDAALARLAEIEGRREYAVKTAAGSILGPFYDTHKQARKYCRKGDEVVSRRAVIDPGPWEPVKEEGCQS